MCVCVPFYKRHRQIGFHRVVGVDYGVIIADQPVQSVIE